MGFSTFAEMNHDLAYRIAEKPDEFAKLMTDYASCCDKKIADELLSKFGVSIWRSGSRDGRWENEARCHLNFEYREQMEEIRARNANG